MRSLLQKKNTQKVNKKRLQLLGWLFSLLLGVILGRTFWFQIVHRDYWASYAPIQYKEHRILAAQRGAIFDRNGFILTMDDSPQMSLAVDPGIVGDKKAVADSLCKFLGGQTEDYSKLLNRTGHFVWVKKQLSLKEKMSLQKANINGLIRVEEKVRTKPYGNLAASVLGVTNKDRQGVGGIEQAYNNLLRGEDGYGVYQLDGFNRTSTSLDYIVENQDNGKHLVLTLDHVMQTIVEDELRKGVLKNKAKGGSAVLMNPFNGDILAMVSVRNEERLTEKDLASSILYNYAIEHAYEPGSTLKVAVAAAALEESLFKTDELIYCENGSYEIHGKTIKDDDRKFGWLTFSDVVQQSSNIGMIKIAKRLGPELIYKYLQNFGFGNLTGLHLPGETPGIFRPVYQWGNLSMPSISFGQEIAVNTVQMANMFSVIANNGELVKPRLVKFVLDEEHQKIKEFPSKTIRRVISSETAAKMQYIMEKTVTDGTGKFASVKGLRVAGKTGTAQKSAKGYKGYLPHAYTSSFGGFWPADTPMYVLMITLDESRRLHSGSKTAAPIFAKIVKRMVGITTVPKEPFKHLDEESTFAFSSLSHSVDDVQVVNNKMESKNHIPNLIGLTLGDALMQLAERGVRANVEGHGVVVSQNPKSGTLVKDCHHCQLTCKSKGRI